MATTDLTATRLREVLNYDLETGAFTWTSTYRKKSAIVGRISRYGYVEISIDATLHKAHRLAWLYVTGAHPTKVIDHIDGNQRNNCFANLRDVSQTSNLQNQRKPGSRNTSGYLGVNYHKKCWRATIRIDGAAVHLGHFATPELAHQAYLAAKRIHHPTCTI